MQRASTIFTDFPATPLDEEVFYKYLRSYLCNDRTGGAQYRSSFLFDVPLDCDDGLNTTSTIRVKSRCRLTEKIEDPRSVETPRFFLLQASVFGFQHNLMSTSSVQIAAMKRTNNIIASGKFLSSKHTAVKRYGRVK
jgi:hypothetical protein